ncbi:LysR family transcriptional regulator [Variovorax sp. PDNC026]|uniref:LysR family transcriptional regulator n=1 Tax=Variovorax sp. PDNC026 TaxID=2811425 RepID=UPI001964AA17|nr:LysR family transcriptional regulator [Variovorax sp. PDNC026]QRY31850.1 LysR family transcriptional regulator [Variovorax sp. PDNC026]
MLDDLQVFEAAARCRSFSEAARLLNLPSSSVSRRIGALEHRMGTALFVRTTRHLELTEAGRVYLDAVQRALAELSRGQSAVSGLGGQVRGTLVVDARVALGSRLIVPILPPLLRAHPQLRIDLRLKHSLSPDLADGVDIGVRYEIGPDSELISCKFATSRRVLVASPDYLARRGTPHHPDELPDHDCIGFVSNNSPQPWRFKASDFTASHLPSGPIQCNDAFSMRAAAEAGLGIVATHDWVVADQVGTGLLVPLLEEFEVSTLTSFETPLYLIYNPHLRNVAKVRAFIDHVVGHYRGALISPWPRQPPGNAASA